MCLFSRDAARNHPEGERSTRACYPISRRIRSQAAAAKSDAFHTAGETSVSTGKIAEALAGASVSPKGKHLWPTVCYTNGMAIPFRRILVPIDFTEVSTHALDWAIELAASVGASVTVMHSYAIPVAGFPDGALIPTPPVAAALRDGAQKALEAAVQGRRGGTVPLETMLREGEAWEEIV